MKISSKDYVAAIIAVLNEKNRLLVSFDPKSYDPALTKDELPWCVKFDALIDTVSIRPELKEVRDKICVSVCVNGYLFYAYFDGSENEDFEHLFFEVYDELRNGYEEEADIWLDRFVHSRFRAKNDAVIENAKRTIILRIKDIVSAEGGSVEFGKVKAVRLDKLDLDADVVIPYAFCPVKLEFSKEEEGLILSYRDDENKWTDNLKDLSLCDVQSILYTVENELY